MRKLINYYNFHGWLHLLPASNGQAQPQPVSLFNGNDLTGWHADVPDMDKDASLKSPFIVRNGLLVSLGTPGGHLITNSVYRNYRLQIEYRFASKPGNCGVLVHASTHGHCMKCFRSQLKCRWKIKMQVISGVLLRISPFLIWKPGEGQKRNGALPRARTDRSQTLQIIQKNLSANGIPWS